MGAVALCVPPAFYNHWNPDGERGEKNFLHFDELEQYDFNNTGRNVLQQQSKTPDNGGSLHKDLLSGSVPCHFAK